MYSILGFNIALFTYMNVLSISKSLSSCYKLDNSDNSPFSIPLITDYAYM